MNALDENYAEESVIFIEVLNELAKAVLRWFPDSTLTQNKDKLKDSVTECNCDKQMKVERYVNESSDLAGDVETEEKVFESAVTSVNNVNESDENKKDIETMDEACCCRNKVETVDDLPSGELIKSEGEVEELKKYFINFFKLEREAKGDISEEELNNFRYFLVFMYISDFRLSDKTK